MTPSPIAIRIRGLTKSFPGVAALRGIDLDILSGEVHGLVGENGAGKSTLIKHLTGLYAPDSGSIELFGRPLNADARAAQQAGIGVIYQERAILPELTAAANVFLGRQKSWGPFLNRRATIRTFRELADRLGVTLDPDARAGSLSVAGQQILEIMRALESEHRILIMDEPATSLGASERERLHGIVDSLRQQGLSIIFISHDLDEILGICDRVSVMRDGALVATRATAAWSKSTLVASMLGDVDLKRTTTMRKPPSANEVLRVESLSIPGTVSDVSFALRAGEILGLAGLVGAGRTEVLRALAGIDQPSAGRLFLRGQEVVWPRTVAKALGYGIALSPEDRKSQGIILELSGAANVVLPNLRSVSTAGIVSDLRLRRDAANAMEGLAFDTTRLGDPAGTLSGGNQQKLVIGKWLHRKPAILLLDEPTQGIDVGAKAEIYSVVSRLANEGMAVILVSSEFEEIVDVCDRVLLLGHGRSLGMLDHDDLSIKLIFDRLFHTGAAA